MSKTAREIEVYKNKIYGVTVSDYGLEKGYLDYKTVAEIIGDCILNNDILFYIDGWDLVCGEDPENEIQQYFIITKRGYEFIKMYLDDPVFYHEELDMYLWGITHFGTSWDYVLTRVKLVDAIL